MDARDLARAAFRPRITTAAADDIIRTVRPPTAGCPPCPDCGPVRYDCSRCPPVYRPDCPKLVMPPPAVEVDDGLFPLPTGYGPSVIYGPEGQPIETVGAAVAGAPEWYWLAGAAVAGLGVWYYASRKKKRRRSRKAKV